MKIKYNLIMAISLINAAEQKKLIKNNEKIDEKYISNEKNIAYTEYMFTNDQIVHKFNQIEQNLYAKYYDENKLSYINYKKKHMSLKKEKDQKLEKNRTNQEKIKEIKNQYANLEIASYKEYLNSQNQNTKKYKEEIANNIYLKNKNLLNAYINYVKKIQSIEQNAL